MPALHCSSTSRTCCTTKRRQKEKQAEPEVCPISETCMKFQKKKSETCMLSLGPLVASFALGIVDRLYSTYIFLLHLIVRHITASEQCQCCLMYSLRVVNSLLDLKNENSVAGLSGWVEVERTQRARAYPSSSPQRPSQTEKLGNGPRSRAERRETAKPARDALSWGPRVPAMEVGGDGGGLPEARIGELESLLEEIKSSEVRHHLGASRHFFDSVSSVPSRPFPSP